MADDFNPRPHKEGDVCFAHRRECHYNISIHALVKRATTYHKFVAIVIGNFNPRPREEGDDFCQEKIPKKRFRDFAVKYHFETHISLNSAFIFSSFSGSIDFGELYVLRNSRSSFSLEQTLSLSLRSR